jgi:RNA polymerase sigma-70 factor (ECF subfamily)
MDTTMANSQPAFVAYQRAQNGTYQPHAVHVLTLDTSGVAHIAVFREPTICRLFTR